MRTNPFTNLNRTTTSPGRLDCLTLLATPATSAEQPLGGPVQLPTFPFRAPAGPHVWGEFVSLEPLPAGPSQQHLTALLRRDSEGRGAQPLLQADPVFLPQPEPGACGQVLCPGIQWAPSSHTPPPTHTACMDFFYLFKTNICALCTGLAPRWEGRGPSWGEGNGSRRGGEGVRPLAWPVGPATPFLLPGPLPPAAHCPVYDNGLPSGSQGEGALF